MTWRAMCGSPSHAVLYFDELEEDLDFSKEKVQVPNHPIFTTRPRQSTQNHSRVYPKHLTALSLNSH